MLVSLHVKNLALIEEIEVEFGPGLNILSGETGAGKSILLGSIQLILGGKTAKGMIRESADYALVELIFSVDDENTAALLKEMDLEPEEDGTLIFSRKITETRSINRINGQTTTLAQMKAAAQCLLDVHGQHEGQSLLQNEKQLSILDEFGKDSIAPIKAEVNKAWKAYKKAADLLKSLDIDEEEKNRRQAFLEFEVNEIGSAHLLLGEDEELEKSYRKLSNSRNIMQAASQAHQLTGYSGEGAGDLVGNALHELERMQDFDGDLDPICLMLRDIDSLLNDFNRELSSYMDGLSVDDQALYETEQRLDLINSLKNKYGRQIKEILSYKEKQEEKLKALLQLDQNREAAKEALRAEKKKLASLCSALTAARKESAALLEKQVVSSLKDLNFLDVRFQIGFTEKDHFTDNGRDAVEYMIATNPGESMKALGKVASGGELSRIMLALKAILADKDRIGTLIFDEIDTGISGRTAQKVSEKMAYIARTHQVLCITHLPQIAAMASTHFEIEKHTSQGQTITEIHPLDEENSVKELARLLGGVQITGAVLENAREMKAQAREWYQQNK